MCSFTDKLRTAKNFELLLERDEITWTLKIAQDENYNKEHKVDELMLSKHILSVSSFKKHIFTSNLISSFIFTV